MKLLVFHVPEISTRYPLPFELKTAVNPFILQGLFSEDNYSLKESPF
jgi:hypothetical protein